jgi:hypothetical protein
MDFPFGFLLLFLSLFFCFYRSIKTGDGSHLQDGLCCNPLWQIVFSEADHSLTPIPGNCLLEGTKDGRD